LKAGLGEIGLRGKVWCPKNLYFFGELGLVAGLGNQDCSFDVSAFEYTPAATDTISKGYFKGSETVAVDAQYSEPKNCSDSIKHGLRGFTGLDYKFEVGYELECFGVFWKIQAGYEGVYLYDISLHTLPEAGGSNFERTTSNLGFAGPYIGLSASLPF